MHYRREYLGCPIHAWSMLEFGRLISHSMLGSPAHGGRTRLLSSASQRRFLQKQEAPMGPGEVRRIERWLATARLTLAISALFAIWMDPTQISWWAHWLLGIYIIHGTVVMFLLRFRKHSTPAFRSLIHAVDLV